jgi:hypothetical protein
MPTEHYVGAAKKQDAKKALQKRPVLVLFYMKGCPHCISNTPAWEDAKKKYGGRAVEIEASATDEVQGFPTMKYISEGGEEKTIEGEKQSGGQILTELGVPKSCGGKSRRRLRHTRNRKLRHRTLRNHIPLV